MAVIRNFAQFILYAIFADKDTISTRSVNKEPQKECIVDHHFRCDAELDRYVSGSAAAAFFGR